MTGTCHKCHQRPATEIWVGDGGVMGWIHGISEQWCQRCVIVEQIAHAKKMAAQLPILEQQLITFDQGNKR